MHDVLMYAMVQGWVLNLHSLPAVLSATALGTATATVPGPRRSAVQTQAQSAGLSLELYSYARMIFA